MTWDDLRSDRELLSAHVDGDTAAFGVLFARHRDRLWAVALRTCSNPEEAADSLQEALISAFRRAGSFRGDSQVTTWLHRVVVNACLDRMRANKVRAADALPDDLDEWADRGALQTSDPAPRPDDAAEASERRTAVLSALGTLPSEQRAALVLVDMEGYSVAEVAEILECAPGTVKSRCARGRAKLATLLLEHRPGDPDHEDPRNQIGPRAVPSTDPARGPPAEPTV
ncbi:RNA polymerase sigma factor SigM [Nocardioides alcanivorans]|uniref:RNA polymerase sigma factor SigM n=1 Tax=Nocardioides alcanivorans TaxID=2897352 RepID=UPI001F217C4E|nr:RNA polymerase sigma factor SigM [Nocardioides alcanivorans]